MKITCLYSGSLSFIKDSVASAGGLYVRKYRGRVAGASCMFRRSFHRSVYTFRQFRVKRR